MADPVNVLVVFYSRYGRAERLALAAGVGAIEAEGNIRLRRLPDDATPEVIQADVAWRESLDRMNRDYVAPRPADPVWADVIVLATPADSSREIESYVSTLPGLGPMNAKIAAPLTPGDDAACDGVFVSAARSGFVCVPMAPLTGTATETELQTHVRLHGQRLVQLARALKAVS
jgi:hypothetical protein